MKKTMLAVVNVVSLMLLVGCVHTLQTKQDVDFKNQHYMSYTQLSDDSLNKIVDDAVDVLVSQFPPATTRFDVTPPVPDDKFGRAFYSRLLTNGFAILEVNLAQKSGNSFLKENEQLRSYKLRYSVHSTNTDYINLIILVDKQVFSRSFGLINGEWSPVGVWTKRS